MHSENYVWGTALNPYDQERSCGGSSGGDGALVSARCVPISFGTDIGGSIRIPAHFNGVRGLRPSPWRIPVGNVGALPNNFTHLS
jgi:Asp-tRNA(Asn)/Glu-tRNA(Gln) amidotransferase A subunit family amidase